MLTIKSENLVSAKYVTGWNICLWGNPKLHIICGNCEGQFLTRQYRPFFVKDQHVNTVACCSYCGKWNKLGLVYG